MRQRGRRFRRLVAEYQQQLIERGELPAEAAVDVQAVCWEFDAGDNKR